MEQDLRNLLWAWLGGNLDEPRHAPLLARLTSDMDFRKAFVDEIRLLGMLKAVQATEPRWLLLEDALGWQASAPAEDAFEDRVVRAVDRLPRFASLPWRRLAWASAALLLFGAFASVWFSKPAPPRDRVPSDSVAVLVELEKATWGALADPPREGSVRTTGPFRLASGRATLSFVGGVTLVVEGPADLDLQSAEKVFCREGKLRAHVPPGAEGFAITAPGAAVVDQGTELALNVGRDGRASLLVFEGRAEVSVLNQAGDTVSSRQLASSRAVEINPTNGRIDDTLARPENFIAAPALQAPALDLDPGYAAAVLASRPWGYWRFESLPDGRVPNAIAHGPPLRAFGPLRLAGPEGGNHTIVFQPQQPEQQLMLEGAWTPSRDSGYAVELWCLSESIRGMALLSLIAREDDPIEKHTMLLQLTGRPRDHLHQPGVLRFLHRWPPGTDGGVNLFSHNVFLPYRWHHLVAQKNGESLELFLDGNLVGQLRMDEDDSTAPCQLLLGRLKQRPLPPPNKDQVRSFVGQVDELAVFDRPLSSAEVRHHYELGTAATRKP